MKKKTNIMLFSGLAVIFILMVVGVLTCFSVKDNEITTLPNKPEKVEIRDLEAFDAIDNEGIQYNMLDIMELKELRAKD